MQKEKLKILASSTGSKRTLTLEGFLKLIEEISISDVIRGGLTKDKTLDKGFLWVISRLSFHIRRVPLYDEETTLESFALPRLRSFFPRGYRLLDKEGNILIEGEGIWALLDEKTRQIIDPTKEGISIRKSNTPPGFNPAGFSFIDKPVVGESHLSHREVLESEIDLNGHLTNARYGDWFIDAFKDDVFPSLSTLSFAFYKEIHSNMEISLKRTSDGKRLSLEGSSLEGPLFCIVAQRK